MLKKLLLASALILAPAAVALAQDFAPNLPIIGGSSYCSATNNSVCTNTVPAGPAVTGNETVPVDTNISSAGGVQSAKIGLPALGAGTLDYSVPVTTNTVTATAQTRQIIVNPAGTIAALTLVTPAATGLVNGQRLGFCSTQVITTLTTTAGSGTTVSNAPTAMVAAGAAGSIDGNAICVEWIYRQANTTWYRVQ